MLVSFYRHEKMRASWRNGVLFCVFPPAVLCIIQR